jgi:hypothetical protein
MSRVFLRRHGEASARAAAAVRTAADALATLRDNLWHTVDGKVAAAMAAEDRAPDDWLAAAQTVTTGAGDRAAASEQVDQAVKPFVDNDIRGDWLAAMRSAMSAVMDFYDAATAELAAEPDAVFDVPGELGPSWTPPRAEEAATAATVPAAASSMAPPVAAPAAWGAPPAPMAAPPPPPAPPQPTPLPPTDAGTTAPAMAAPPSMPSLGGMPDIGSGLSGFGQQLADAFGSLLGSADEALGEDKLDDDQADDEPVDPADDVDEDPADEEPAEEAVAEGTCDPGETPVGPTPSDEIEPAPTPVPEPLPGPAPPPEPVAAETPCEIAADELPQVGE